MEPDALQQSSQSPRSRQSPTIDPGLGWTYLSREALARAKAQMDAESTGMRDELGFLTIHQRYVDLFFPGTSVLHGRARYALFVPWLFEDLAGFDDATAKRELQARECQLAGRLIEPGSQQVIGGTVFPRAASHPRRCIGMLLRLGGSCGHEVAALQHVPKCTNYCRTTVPGLTTMDNHCWRSTRRSCLYPIGRRDGGAVRSTCN
ncbi:DUF6361 family protein [Pseudomonas laurylsulfatiphila]|uniref:DUF6361 family protein n=1 Tax=Pseudomonas laurylsulfatiphila TaxID=2011015 RepID=UPI003D238F9B